VRSPHAHAEVLDIDVAGALDVDGLVAVYTYEDLSARMAEPLPLLIPHASLTHARTQYALARDVVHHVGEPVVMVVARDRYLAEDAAERIVVSWRPLPAVVGIRAARAAEQLVHPDVPGNVAANLVQSVGDVESALRTAPHILELDLSIERSASTPLEGRGVLARWDPDSRRLRLWTSTQTSTGVRAAVASKLALALVDVDVITPDVGGGFGVKIMHPWPEEVLVPWASRTAGSTSSPARTSALSCTTSGSASTTRVICSDWTCGSGMTMVPTSRTGSSSPSSPRPSCSVRTSRARTASSSTRCTRTR